MSSPDWSASDKNLESSRPDPCRDTPYPPPGESDALFGRVQPNPLQMIVMLLNVMQPLMETLGLMGNKFGGGARPDERRGSHAPGGNSPAGSGAWTGNDPGRPQSDQPNELVMQLLLLLVMESLTESMGDPFATAQEPDDKPGSGKFKF